MKKIKIAGKTISVTADLLDTPTAQSIWDALPITGEASTWGDEIYFEIPVTLEQEKDARADVEAGDLGYWPVGRCFCVFFGRTPMSTGPKPRAASEVNVFGKVVGQATVLRGIRDGETVTVERGGGGGMKNEK